MIRKLVSLAIATVATAGLLGAGTTPAHADSTSGTISIRSGSGPEVSATTPGDATSLVGAITGTVGGVHIDATSCRVSGPIAGPGTATGVPGAVYVIGGCAGAGDWSATITQNPDGTATGTVTGAAAGKWSFKAGCHVMYFWGAPVGVDCYFEVTWSE
jgi:hypothetical protein